MHLKICSHQSIYKLMWKNIMPLSLFTWICQMFGKKRQPLRQLWLAVKYHSTCDSHSLLCLHCLHSPICLPFFPLCIHFLLFSHYFDHFLLTPLVVKGLLLCGYGYGYTDNIRHWTDYLDSNLLITYTHSPWKGTLHIIQATWGCSWEQSEQVDDVGGRLCSIKGVRWLLVLKGGCD